MLSEQLKEKKQNIKTLLHNRKSLITFLSNSDMDNTELLRQITIPTKYTTTKSLHFERHSLTIREETRFNIKFVEFLNSLALHMCNKNINYILEYLIRIYHIDTYNTEELLFLILPYKYYTEQIRIIGKNCGCIFGKMCKYSIGFICRVIRDDIRYFKRYCNYFRYYAVLKVFLDKTIEEMAVLLQGQECKYVTELYEAMNYLIQGKHFTVALKMYHQLRKHMNTSEFLELLHKNFTDEDILGEEVLNTVDIYSEIHLTGRGRELLSVNYDSIINKCDFATKKVTLFKYIKYLMKNEKIPSEFSEEEFCILKSLVNNDKYIVKDAIKIDKLYFEMNGCLKLTELLIEVHDFNKIYTHANSESVTYILNSYKRIRTSVIDCTDNKNNNYIIAAFKLLVNNLLTEDNHNIILRNIRRDIFEKFYDVFLYTCLKFISFDCSFFNQYLTGMREKSGVRSQNIVLLAEKTGYNLMAELVEDDWKDDTAYLGYVLRHARGMNKAQVAFIISCIKTQVNTWLIADANIFLVENYFSELVVDFLIWRSNDLKSVEKLVERLVKSFDTKFLFDFMIETKNKIVLFELVCRPDDRLVMRLYDLRQFELLFELARNGYIDKVLNCTHSNVYEFINKYFIQFNDCDVVISFLLDKYDDKENDNNKNILQLLMTNFVTLVRFRHHKKWSIAKIILIECLNKEYMMNINREKVNLNNNISLTSISIVLDYVIENIDKFINDLDLFEQLISNSSVNHEIFKKITIKNCQPAAEFIDIFIFKTNTNLLPVLPFIMPLLLKYALYLKYAQQTLEMIYKEYNKLLGLYSEILLRNCPQFSNLLNYVDSRYSLPAIYNVLNDYLKNDKIIDTIINNNLTDKNIISIILTLENIFNNKIITNLNLINKTIDFILSHSLSDTTYIAFIRFYIESFGATENDNMKNFIAYIFEHSHNVFQKIPREFISRNKYIFLTAIDLALKMIFTSNYDKALEFFSEFYTYYNYSLPISTLEFAKHIYSLYSLDSFSLISTICIRDPNIVFEFNIYIEKQFNTNKEYALLILNYLYQNTNVYRVNLESTRKIALIHTEDTNLNVSKLAKTLYNVLCLEK